jgi:hypothetical protein
MPWRTYTFICATVPVLTFVLMYFAPESPLYLVERGDEGGAMLALVRLRGASSSMQVENELADVR